MKYLVYINVVIFFSISLLHFYWAAGGKWALDGAIPEKFERSFYDEKYKMLNTLATIVVAFGLLAFMIITLGVYGYGDYPTFGRYLSYALYTIGAIFSIRAIGDFNMFGLFKKKTESLFEQRDSQIYVPLCLYLGLSSFLIAYNY